MTNSEFLSLKSELFLKIWKTFQFLSGKS